jgi:hypothetical protein
MRSRRNVLLSNLFIMGFMFFSMCSEYVSTRLYRERPSIVFGKANDKRS